MRRLFIPFLALRSLYALLVSRFSRRFYASLRRFFFVVLHLYTEIYKLSREEKNQGVALFSQVTRAWGVFFKGNRLCDAKGDSANFVTRDPRKATAPETIGISISEKKIYMNTYIAIINIIVIDIFLLSYTTKDWRRLSLVPPTSGHKREGEIKLHWIVVQNKSDCRFYYSEILDLIIVRWEETTN